MELVFSGGCRGESSVALCFGKIQVVGRKGEGEEGGVAAGPVWGASILGDAGMKGWALAASLDSWYSLADPPLSQLGLWGPRFRKQGFFFLLSRGVLFACGPERKAGFLPASSCKQGLLET